MNWFDEALRNGMLKPSEGDSADNEPTEADDKPKDASKTEWEKERDRRKQFPAFTKCPKCAQFCRTLWVKKSGRNHGRPFISCEACDVFQFCDTEKCACNWAIVERTVRKPFSKFKGRKFWACSNPLVVRSSGGSNRGRGDWQSE